MRATSVGDAVPSLAMCDQRESMLSAKSPIPNSVGIEKIDIRHALWVETSSH